ncbi:hypothetical protein [Caulobacter sp. NIBR1757]|uniref:hypothetical protein n=1 Tax=Caulobacter sp. NIBR1757 TaxID=3016000 RepID=UPI0022F0C920|nr:hypothetical protein [Caulobacter sp. NIBR1757]WGM39010.1 hypothetical protein AMEJIAPC_01920 [Caulobacter sp. NIBR1757]
MLFKPKTNRADFEREVLLEIAYMRDLHGDEAYLVATERARRPHLGGPRKRVIEEAARRLAAEDNGPATNARR